MERKKSNGILLFELESASQSTETGPGGILPVLPSPLSIPGMFAALPLPDLREAFMSRGFGVLKMVRFSVNLALCQSFFSINSVWLEFNLENLTLQKAS